jgi:response regulator RpfG family c-di-GMP phosphodiesterase
MHINEELNFLEESEEIIEEVTKKYKIIIADDDEEVHRVTKVILKFFDFEGAGLQFLDAYDGEEAKILLNDNPDTAIIFLDVVMESSDSGLKVVRYLRETLQNHLTRIVLRTGQPGEAPEEEIIKTYDINDYRLKTELTVKRLNTTIYSALRNYRDLLQLDKNRKGLEKIIKASSKLFEHNTLNEFLKTILSELSSFNHNELDMIFVREDLMEDGVVILEQQCENKIIAGTGKFSDFVNEDINGVTALDHVKKWIASHEGEDGLLHELATGFIISSKGKSNLSNYIYIDGKHGNLDLQLINLFLSNFSIALDNYILNNMLQSSQEEIVFTLAETVENHFEETGSHTKRIAEMMYQFALKLRCSYAESEMIKLAATMHDLGKVAIPDYILKKPGKLDIDEFEVMKRHAQLGYNILKKPQLPIIKMASEIALYHHEKYDGSGYPIKLKGLEIPLYARMMAIVDVYDAMTHDRIYRKKMPISEAIDYIKSESGRHFDPELVKVFLDNINDIVSN